jgi:ribonucleotide reductase alpha subunit
MDDLTVGQETENLEVGDTTNNDTTQTDEVGNKDVDKQEGVEKSVYEIELERVNAELAKKDDIISKKNRALEAEKKANKAIDKDVLKAEIRDELKKELSQEWKSDLNQSELDRKLNALTADPAERELIKTHYNNSIVKSGNLDEDLQYALAIANRKTVFDQRVNRAIEEKNENFLTSFQGSDIRSKMSGVTQDPIKQQAAELLKNWGQDKAAENLLKK